MIVIERGKECEGGGHGGAACGGWDDTWGTCPHGSWAKIEVRARDFGENARSHRETWVSGGNDSVRPGSHEAAAHVGLHGPCFLMWVCALGVGVSASRVEKITTTTTRTTGAATPQRSGNAPGVKSSQVLDLKCSPLVRN